MSNPTIAEAKELCKKHRKSHLIILFVDNLTRQVGYASYGSNKMRCSEAEMFAEKAFKAVKIASMGRM